MKKNSMYRIWGFTLVLALVLVSSVAFAEIDWSKMSSEEIQAEIQAAQAELASRNSEALELGKTITIQSKYGTYIFTIDGAHLLTSDYWIETAKERWSEEENYDGMVYVAIQGVVVNVDYEAFENRNYLPSYMIQMDMTVTDQDGFALEMDDGVSGGDGRYDIWSTTSPGEKRRVSLLFFAFTDTTSVTISFKGYDGSVTIPLK